MKTTKVSILMPTRNRASFIGRAAASVIGNGYGDFELVIQDGSPSWKPTVESLPDDHRISYCHQQDSNLTEALNRAYRRATGDVFGWLNDDDEHLRGSYQAAVEALRGSEGPAWCYGSLLGRPQELWSKARLRLQNFVPQPCVFWNRAMAEAVGEFDGSLKLAQDYDYWIRCGDVADPITLGREVAEYHLHGGSLTSTNLAEQLAEADLIRRRLNS